MTATTQTLQPGRPRRQPPVATFLRLGRDPLRLALIGLMLVTIGRIHQVVPGLAVLRPALVLVGAIALYTLLNPRYVRPDNLRRVWIPQAILALAAFACVSVPFAFSLGGSASFILTDYSKVIVFAVLLIIAVRSVRDLFTLVWGYVLGAGVLVWLSLFVYGLQRHGGTGVARLAHLQTFDANDVGLIFLVALPLTLLVFQTSSSRGKLLAGALLAGLGAAIARTGSRGAFLGLVVLGFLLLVALKRVSVTKRLGFLAVALAALLVAAPQGYWDQMRTLLTPTSDYNWETTNGRKEVAKRGFEYMMQRPIFGLGMDGFWRAECFLSDKAKQHFAGTGLRCTPPHNSWVQAGAELGIPGLLLWGSVVIGGIGSMVKLRRRLPPAWVEGDAEERFLYLASLYLMLAMVGFAVTCTFLSFAWIDPVYILAAFMTGLHVCVRDKLGRGGPRQPAVAVPRRPGRFPASPGFIAAPR